MATDIANNAVVSWRASVNDPQLPRTAMARAFSPTGSPLKNDFRVDLANRPTALLSGSPRVSRGNGAGHFAFAWADDRANDAGHGDVYTRALPVLH